MNTWVKYGQLQEGRSNLPPARRASDPPEEEPRLTKLYEDDEKTLLQEAYRAAGEGSQATWTIPETPVKRRHEYFKLITSARFCNTYSAQTWPEDATVYLMEADKKLSPVIECRPGRGGSEFAVYVAGECGPRIVDPDDLFYITDQPDVRGRSLQEIEDGSRNK